MSGLASAEHAGIVAVVVSYQSGSTIDTCLTRLRAASGVDQIRVVDNGSTDATLGIVQRHASLDPRLHFIANPDNPGFSVACNQGAAASDAPWLAFRRRLPADQRACRSDAGRVAIQQVVRNRILPERCHLRMAEPMPGRGCDRTGPAVARARRDVRTRSADRGARGAAAPPHSVSGAA